MRFLVGMFVGASLMYWYLTGQVPYRERVEDWFKRTASSYTGERQKSEADRLIEGQPARSP